MLLNLASNLIQASTSVATINDPLVYGRMSGITRFIYENFSRIDADGVVDYTIPGYITLVVIFALSALVFKLGFARELPLMKNIIIYLFLFVGCILLTLFAFFLPMIEGLIVAALILIVYKTRMWREKREQAAENNN
ncbi:MULTISPECIES: YlaH-like family protein [Bacillales]|uniref:YlaH-like family protein n=1 Tax=Lysinibacillus louembei TaxID=1470088 RepID=A0ABZ0RX90_9BACI|nr:MULTISPECIES: YlaH-like family protein [Bacillales]MCT6923965.1 YlaH-like family protein [Metasolibacillus sp.]MCT6940177.1 YlaH-like family protein [Metasolibacillus sp.]WPK12100.1 YlaH-like family protein [Lysinibacillus louembei]